MALLMIPEEILELQSTLRDFIDREIRPREDREAFGRPIGHNQYVQGMLVDSHAELEQTRLLSTRWRATSTRGRMAARRRHRPSWWPRRGWAGWPTGPSRSTGNGFMTELGLESWYRDVRAMRLYEGTSEILRTNVAKGLGLS